MVIFHFFVFVEGFPGGGRNDPGDRSVAPVDFHPRFETKYLDLEWIGYFFQYVVVEELRNYSGICTRMFGGKVLAF